MDRFPRTPHLPWSDGVGDDDVVGINLPGGLYVATEKMDGEQTTMTADACYARSPNSGRAVWRSDVKRTWGDLRRHIPSGWRVCGENLYAAHSIQYRQLDALFQVFSIWNEHAVILDWDETRRWCAKLGLTPVPTLWQGDLSDFRHQHVWRPVGPNGDEREGYVLRPLAAFPSGEYGRLVGKYVRPGHVQTDEHWTRRPLVRNERRTQ